MMMLEMAMMTVMVCGRFQFMSHSAVSSDWLVVPVCLISTFLWGSIFVGDVGVRFDAIEEYFGSSRNFKAAR